MSTQENPMTLLTKVVKSNSNSKNTSPQPYSIALSNDKKNMTAERYIITDNKKMYIQSKAPQVFQPKQISVVSIIMDTSIKKTSPKHNEVSIYKRPEHTLVSPVGSFKIGDFSLFTTDLDHPEKTIPSDHGITNIKTNLRVLPKLQLSSIPTVRSDSNLKEINSKKGSISSTRKLKPTSNSPTPLKASPRPILNSYRPSDFSKQGIQNSNQNSGQKANPVRPLPINTERIKNNSESVKMTAASVSNQPETGRMRANKSEGGPALLSARQENHAYHKRPNDLTVDFKDCFKPVLNAKSKVLFKNAEILLKKYKDLKFK